MDASNPAWQDESPEDQPGLYSRGVGRACEWWRVTPSGCAHMYPIEHGRGERDEVDIDPVVDLDDIEAKLLKWRCEGYDCSTQRADEVRAAQAGGAFAGALRQAAASARAERVERALVAARRVQGNATATMRIGDGAMH
ncbi:MAG: hypothetical protein JO239_08095 [Paraburkholderia sp.]|nr:hypothetical protein [Paraburkholderia sp.]